uniref:Protein kinase domain-containing protein n=1 Tax=Heterorhabditis bacteriophora TaxID=37862 RepID=A0A1I7XHG3_HETBA
MDSLFLNTPKPFNKYPSGYRPINGGAGLRTFGSLSSLAHLSSRPSIDSLQADPTHNIQNSYIVFNNINSSCPPTINNRPLHRSGSVDPYMEPPFTNNINSNRIMVTSPRRNSVMDLASADHYRKNSEASPYSQDVNQQNRQQDAFLEKLRRQKEAIENFGRSGNECGLLNLGIDHSRKQQAHQSLYIQGNKANSIYYPGIVAYDKDQNVRSAPHSLHKTKSDSSIFYDLHPPFRQKLNRQLNSDTIYGLKNNSTKDSQEEKGDFFACKNIIEPRWLMESIPPPPIDIQGQNSGVCCPEFPELNSFLCKPKSPTSIIPIKLENDRILKIFHPQTRGLENKAEQLKSKFDDPLTMQIASPHSSQSFLCYDSFQPLSSSYSCINGDIASHPHCKLHSNKMGKVPQTQFVPSVFTNNLHQGSTHKSASLQQLSPPHSPSSTTLPSPYPLSSPQFCSFLNPNSFPSAAPTPFVPPFPTPRPPPPPPPPSSFQKVKISPSYIPPNTKPSGRMRCQSPTIFPEVPAGFQDELLSVIPMRAKKSLSANKRSQSYDIEESRFSPVESKVFPGVNNRINGFGNSISNSRYPCTDSSGSFISTIPIEQSFTIVSRPPTPPAMLQNPTSTLQSLNSRDFLSPLQDNDIQKQSMCSANPTSSYIMPESSRFVNQRLTSISTNDYGNECNILNPHLIFKQVKSHDGLPKPSKKVVFQCDSDVVGRLRASDYCAYFHIYCCFFVPLLFLVTVMLVQFVQDSKRNTPQFNHLCAVAEGIPAVGWVLVVC